MAQIVLGLAAPHSPQLHIPPEIWPEFSEWDKATPDLLVPYDGRPVTYEELLAAAGPSMAKEITPEMFRERWEACQQRIAQVSDALAEADPDVLVMVGTDIQDLFLDSTTPMVSIYSHDTFTHVPRPPVDAKTRAAAWGFGSSEGDRERAFPVHTGLAHHLADHLTSTGCTLAPPSYRRQGQDKGIPLTFAFVYHRIMTGTAIPAVPIIVNNHYLADHSLPVRAHELGRAIGDGIKAWESDSRVAVMGIGGLSHAIVDEQTDRGLLEALQSRDWERVSSLLPYEVRSSGATGSTRMDGPTSQARTWVAVAAAVEPLQMRLLDYIPCYRALAGTGCGMGFARWQ